MKRLPAALCCLMLASSHFALAQDKGAANKPPITQKEQAEMSKAVHTKAAICFHQAERNKLKQGSKEYHQFIGQCLAEKK